MPDCCGHIQAGRDLNKYFAVYSVTLTFRQTIAWYAAGFRQNKRWRQNFCLRASDAIRRLVCPMIVFVAYNGIRLCSLAASRGVNLLPTFPITGICTGATNAGKTFGLLTVMPDGLNWIIPSHTDLQSAPHCHSGFCSVVVKSCK